MEGKHTADSWLKTAVSGIRFGYDRDAAEEELRGHLEDKQAALLRRYPDLSAETAEEMALARMGDPEEIGKALAEIHRPWLGRLWMLTNWAMGLLIAFYALIVLPYLVLCLLLSTVDWEVRDGVLPSSGRVKAWADSVKLEPDGSRIVLDGRLLTMERAWLEERENGPRLCAELRSLSPRFWVDRSAWCQRLTAVDSLGNVYPTWSELRLVYDWKSLLLTQSELPMIRASQTDATPGLLQPPHLFTDWILVSLENLDPEAEWVRLEYDWQGRSFEMTVELKGGGV